MWTQNPSNPPFRLDASGPVFHDFDIERSSLDDRVSGSSNAFASGRRYPMRNSAKGLVPLPVRNSTGGRTFVGFPLDTQIRLPVNPCTHTKSVINTGFTNITTFSKTDDLGNPSHERVTTHSISSPDGAGLARFLGITDLFGSFDSNKQYSESPYGLHDWFALQDSYSEACDQFIPSSFLLGENIVEHAIFVDAFKAILNPTSLVPSFIKLVPRLIKKAHRKNLGQISKELTKQAANDHLSLIFGVLPAISDVRSALEAHRKVGSRLEFLQKNSGRFVPIRVRRRISSDVQNFDPSLGSNLNFFTHVESKYSEACMGSWGRIREDINLGDVWSAYLQYFGINKVVGLAWELIPFSFVVDWFTNAQERINSFTRLDTGGPFTELAGFSCSVKEEKTELLKCYPGYFSPLDAYSTEPRPFVLASKRSTKYERFSNIPDHSGVVDLTNLGLFQFAAGASLLIQRWLR